MLTKAETVNDIAAVMAEVGRKARAAAAPLSIATTEQKNRALIAAADDLFVTQEGRVEQGKGVQMVWRKTGDQGHPF